ncbi:MAG: hypothetical protein WBD22_03575, partial [Pyrinomonadaceae bacterium]
MMNLSVLRNGSQFKKTGIHWMFAAICFVFAGNVIGADFPATAGSLGAIPDNDCDGAGRQIQFVVSGLSAAPTNVRVSFTATHTYVGDLDAFLLAPTGTPFHRIFEFTNPLQDQFGDSSNLGGAYSFFDAASGNWWAAATAAAGSDDIVAPGSYRTASDTGANTSMNPVFAAVS